MAMEETLANRPGFGGDRVREGERGDLSVFFFCYDFLFYFNVCERWANKSKRKVPLVSKVLVSKLQMDNFYMNQTIKLSPKYKGRLWGRGRGVIVLPKSHS